MNEKEEIDGKLIENQKEEAVNPDNAPIIEEDKKVSGSEDNPLKDLKIPPIGGEEDKKEEPVIENKEIKKDEGEIDTNVLLENKIENNKEIPEIENKENPDIKEGQNKEETYENLLEKANEFMIHFNYKESEKIYSSILSNFKNLDKDIKIDIYYHLALCNFNQIKYKESVKYAIDILMNLDNKFYEAYAIIIKVLIEIDELVKADNVRQKAKHILKDEPEKLFMMNDLFVKLDNQIRQKKSIEYFYKEKNTQRIIYEFFHNKILQFSLISGGMLGISFLINKLLNK